MNQEDLAFLGLKLGGSFVIGFTIGYFIKKSLKIAMYIIGFQLVIFFIAEYFGLINVIDTGLIKAANGFSEGMRIFWNFLYNRLALFPTQTIGATAGILIGLKKG